MSNNPKFEVYRIHDLDSIFESLVKKEDFTDIFEIDKIIEKYKKYYNIIIINSGDRVSAEWELITTHRKYTRIVWTTIEECPASTGYGYPITK